MFLTIFRKERFNPLLIVTARAANPFYRRVCSRFREGPHPFGQNPPFFHLPRQLLEQPRTGITFRIPLSQDITAESHTVARFKHIPDVWRRRLGMVLLEVAG